MLEHLLSEQCRKDFDDWQEHGCRSCGGHRAIIRRLTVKLTTQEYWKVTCSTQHCGGVVFKALNTQVECEGHSA